MRVIRFELARPTLLLNQTKRMHYQAISRYRAGLAWEIRCATMADRMHPPVPRAHVRVERHSVQLPDQDGLVGGLKELIDCLVLPGKPRIVGDRTRFPHPHGLGLIVDDRPACMTLDAVSVKTGRTAQRTVVVITELPTPA